MLKNLAGLTLSCLISHSLCAETLDLHKADLNSLAHFSRTNANSKKAHALAAHNAESNALQEISQTLKEQKTITRYQQMYRGIPVVGAQVTLSTNTSNQVEVNGHLFDNIQINTKPTISRQEALLLAQKIWLANNPQVAMSQEEVELQLREQPGQQLALTYQVSFHSKDALGKPAWLFFLIDAQTGTVKTQWDNIKNFADSGPGGNEKVKEYWYGKDGLPALEVAQNGFICTMEHSKVKLVNVNFGWDWNDLLTQPYQYHCGQNQEDLINGAFSPINDAYYFGQVIVDMYRNWYGLNALQNADGSVAQLVMRVHFGMSYDNAFWNGQTMSFGDGEDFYPLVSLDVAGHEVTHGFTQQHANLEYHDQSGALNESMSDMGGQATRAYLLETLPQFYNKLYLKPNEVTWGIGETIVRDGFGQALRFMDYPSSDGSSADCLDKDLARSYGAYCAINYDDVLKAAGLIGFLNQQNYIVHTASGIFNKAFYLLSKELGIKKAYHLMLVANTKYWTPTSDFQQAACGVLASADELAIDKTLIKNSFGQVGVSTESCK